MREKHLSRQLFTVEELPDIERKFHKLDEYIIPFFTTLLKQIKTRESNRSTKVILKNSAKRTLNRMKQHNSDEIVDLVIRLAQLDGNVDLDKNKSITSLQKQLDIFNRYAQLLKYEMEYEN